MRLCLKATLITWYSKSKVLKSQNKLWLQEDTSTPGTLDHKLVPMMMEEDLSLSSRHSDCSRKMDSDPEELSDLLLGVGKNQEVM